MKKKNILVTGGSGYIGSHVCVELLNNDYEVKVIDNLINSSEESLKRVEKITGKKVTFKKVDLRDEHDLADIFDGTDFDAVIHLAGLKAVGESVEKPLLYYENNIVGSINLFDQMKRHGIDKIVFSSSACVYGEPDKVPITENFPIKPTNPYGQTKATIEQILKDISISDNKFSAVILRYFNPVGAHKSGLIGEDPGGIPNNLVPFIAQVAVGKLDYLQIYGDDYDTKDGTGVRDYIHVNDLAKAHIKALEKLDNGRGNKIYNIGTGKGYSVLEVLKAFEKAIGKNLPYKIAERRSGDAVIVYTDPSLANKELSWTAEKTIDEMCEDVWRWQSKNPNGYK